MRTKYSDYLIMYTNTYSRRAYIHNHQLYIFNCTFIYKQRNINFSIKRTYHVIHCHPN